MGGPGSGRKSSYASRNKKEMQKLVKMRIRKSPTGHISGDVSTSTWRNKKGFKPGR